MNLIDFAKQVKSKFPTYKNVADTVLARKVLQKYPVYLNHLDLEGDSKQEAIKGTETAQNGVLQGVSGPMATQGTKSPAGALNPSLTPKPGSLEANILEFKIKQAIGLKPLDILTPETIQKAWINGKLPKDLAEQIGLQTGQ